MAVSYDLTSDIGLVRLLIKDTKPDNAQFNDAELEAMLALEGGVVKLAAAQCLDAIANDQALLLKRIKTLALETDGPATAKALREGANALRSQVATGVGANEETGFFDSFNPC